jgi:plasmid stability protein
MPTLYVENVPEPLYAALKARAKSRRKSISAEVLELLEQNIPTEEELQRRREFGRKMAEFRAAVSPAPGPFPSAEEMIRADRER